MKNNRLKQGENDFETWCKQNKREDLLEEWDYTENLEKFGKTPKDTTKGVHIDYWWRCKKNHLYDMRIESRINGQGCTYCSGRLPIIGETDLETWCKQNNREDLLEEWDYEANKDLVDKFGRSIATPLGVTKSSGQKVNWKLHYFDKERNKYWDLKWPASIASRTKSIKVGCPQLSGHRVEYGFNDFETWCKDNNKEYLLDEWDYKNNAKQPREYTKSYHKEKSYWICPKGHPYPATIMDRVRGCGCIYCSSTEVLQGFNDLETWCKQNNKEYLLSEWDYSKNKGLTDGYGRDISTPTKVTHASTQNVWWKCNKGHSWQAIIGNRTQGRGCQVCGGFKTERLVCDTLSDLQIQFDFQKVFLGDQIIKNFKFDVWVESLRIIIEPDGLQHFQAGIEFYDKGTTFPNRRKADNLKNTFCLRHNIAILRIPYVYNPDKEQDKIKELILNFINTRKVPQEIIDFYDQYKENNNYADVARQLNAI